jgi:hypothetical protein
VQRPRAERNSARWPWRGSKQELEVSEAEIGSDDLAGAAVARFRLRRWRGEPAFSAIRDAAAIGALPDAERERVRALWNRFGELESADR